MSVRLRGAVLLALAMLVAATFNGCGDEDGDVDPALRSAVSHGFAVKTVDDDRHIVGHGVEMTMPGSWVTYEKEQVGTDGSTWEWAAGLPVATRPLPAGVQFSMGKPGEGSQIGDLPAAAKAVAESSPGYRFLDDGSADVPGARRARFLRFERDLQLDGRTVKVEQVSLFVQVDKGVTSTIRFIAAQGDWADQLQAPYDSVRVAVDEAT